MLPPSPPTGRMVPRRQPAGSPDSPATGTPFATELIRNQAWEAAMGAKASRRGRVWLPVAGLCLGLFAAGWALTGSPRGTDPAGRPDPEYVRWLERQSMLYQAREQA